MAIQIDYMVDVTTGGFGVYWIAEEFSPTPGFVGSWSLCGTVSSGGRPWSPPASLYGNNGNGVLGAYSIDGVLYTFAANYSPLGVVSTNTGIAVEESALYGVSVVSYPYPTATQYIITSSKGGMWESTDFVTWTDISSQLPQSPSEQTITQSDIDNANASAPPGVTFVFGSPVALCGGGVNSHTGPPFATSNHGGAVEYNVPNNNISTRGGAIELTASITGPLPPAVGQGGTREQTGLPVRQEG